MSGWVAKGSLYLIGSLGFVLWWGSCWGLMGKTTAHQRRQGSGHRHHGVLRGLVWWTGWGVVGWWVWGWIKEIARLGKALWRGSRKRPSTCFAWPAWSRCAHLPTHSVHRNPPRHLLHHPRQPVAQCKAAGIRQAATDNGAALQSPVPGHRGPPGARLHAGGRQHGALHAQYWLLYVLRVCA